MDLNVNNMIVESDEEEYPDIVTLEDLNTVCRLCGNCSEQLISIFEAEGLEHTLIEKIREHLPLLQINKNDDLPINICYQCASTLISWHELYYASIDVEKRLKEIGNKIRSNNSDNSFVEVDIVIDDQNKLNKDAIMEHTDTLVYDMLSGSPCEISESVEAADDGSNILPVNIVSSNFIAEANVKLDNMSPEPKRCSSINTNSSKQNLRHRQRSTSPPQNPVPQRINTYHNTQLACKNCSRKFANKIILSIHNNEARVIQANPSIFSLYQLATMHDTVISARGYDLELFECDHCHETFDNKFWLRKHILYLHTDDNKFKCDYCDRRCLTECDLAMHRSVHTLDQKLVCRSCGERNKRSCLPYENGISLGLCACTPLTLDKLNDDSTRKSKNLLLNRQRRNRIGNELCKQEPAEHDETLVNYEWMMGDKERKPKTICENCNKECGSPYNLKKHKRVHGKRIECKVCGKLYFKTYLRLHMQIHAQVKAFVCDKCGKRFAQSSSLRAHKLIEDNIRKLMCNICGMQFILSSRLQSHLKTHMDNKPFKCQDCDREYGYIWQLRQHRVKHSNVREFTCESCAKSYKTMKHLRQHWLHYPTHRQEG